MTDGKTLTSACHGRKMMENRCTEAKIVLTNSADRTRTRVEHSGRGGEYAWQHLYTARQGRKMAKNRCTESKIVLTTSVDRRRVWRTVGVMGSADQPSFGGIARWPIEYAGRGHMLRFGGCVGVSRWGE